MTQAIQKPTARPRRKPPAGAPRHQQTAATQDEAVEIARQMLGSGEMIHVLVSKGTDVFTVRATDDLASFAVMSDLSATRVPKSKLAASIDESRNIRPRFATAEKLFDALENGCASPSKTWSSKRTSESNG